jgi:nucleotide-binding universal stress UspA family protein
MIEDGITLKRIIVPLDGSDSSFRAAKYAIKVAKMANAEIIFMHVVVNPPYRDARNAGIMITAYIKEAKELAELWYLNAGNMASNEDVKFTTETMLDVLLLRIQLLTMLRVKRLILLSLEQREEQA